MEEKILLSWQRGQSAEHLPEEGKATDGRMYVVEDAENSAIYLGNADGNVTQLGATKTDVASAVEASNTEIKGIIGDVTDGKTVVEMIEDASAGAAGGLAGEAQTRADEDAAIRGELAALQIALEDEGKARAEADTTLTTAINTEKSRAEGIEAGLRTDVDDIKADYLKAADKAELEGKITAEENRARGVEESLQEQINTIMNNPDTADVIDSINEFTQYIADHGEIADGFRKDIDDNKEAIEEIYKAGEGETPATGLLVDEINRATAAENALSGRATILESKVDIDGTVSAAIDVAKQAAMGAITAEVTRATTKENELAAAITDGDEATLTRVAELDAALLAELKAYVDGLLTWGTFGPTDPEAN